MSMYEWLIVNLDTGESGRVRASSRRAACAHFGWDDSYCEAHIVHRRSRGIQ